MARSLSKSNLTRPGNGAFPRGDAAAAGSSVAGTRDADVAGDEDPLEWES